jgi:hypothetical protein
MKGGRKLASVKEVDLSSDEDSSESDDFGPQRKKASNMKPKANVEPINKKPTKQNGIGTRKIIHK